MEKPLSEEVKVSDFWDWTEWGVVDSAASSRWMAQNMDTWVLLFTSAVCGEEKALRNFKIYSNFSPSEKWEHQKYLLLQLLDIVALVRKIEKDEAQTQVKLGREPE